MCVSVMLIMCDVWFNNRIEMIVTGFEAELNLGVGLVCCFVADRELSGLTGHIQGNLTSVLEASRHNVWFWSD